LDPTEDGIFVLIMPTCAVGAIIGTKGAKIKEIMEASRCDINVGREAVIGMPDNPMVLNGTQAQVLSATVHANAVLQELAERDRVKEDDFRYIPGRQNAPPRPVSRGGASGLNARFIVSKSTAGFLIGKGGEKIKQLKEESGAFMQFRNAEEEPALCLTDEERVLEVRGSIAEREQGVRVLMAAMDQMSQEPQTNTRMLVSSRLEPAMLEEAAASANVQLTLGADASGEVIATLDGPMFSRSKAIFAMLALLDTQAGGAPPRMESRPSFGTASPPKEQAPARAPEVPIAAAHPVKQVGDDGEEEERIEPETGKAFKWAAFQVEFSKIYSPKDVLDYWRDACKIAPKKTSSMQAEVVPHGSNSTLTNAAEAVHPERRIENIANGTGPSPPVQSHQPLVANAGATQERHTDRSSHAVEVHPAARSEQSFVGDAGVPSFGSARTPDVPLLHETKPVEQSWQERQPQQQEAVKPWQPPQAAARPAESISFTPQPQDMASGASASQQSLLAGAGSGTMWGGFDQQAAMNQMGFNMPGMFGSQCGAPCGQLHLLLPRAVVQGKLVPDGHLAAIAQACSVQIDLADGATPEQLCVVVSGTVVANSLAALMLQWHILFAGG